MHYIGMKTGQGYQIKNCEIVSLERSNTERWVIDGNYSRVRNLVWERADTIVYLNYSFWRTFWQLFTRTIYRLIKQEELWHGNRENLRKSFFSKDLILLWMIQTYKRRRRQYAKLIQQSENDHLDIVQLKTPSMTDEWLSNISYAAE